MIFQLQDTECCRTALQKPEICIAISNILVANQALSKVEIYFCFANSNKKMMKNSMFC